MNPDSHNRPLIKQLSYQLQPAECLRGFLDWTAPVLLESAKRHSIRGRYSYLTADPIQMVSREEANYGDDPFQVFREWLNDTSESVAQLPPFQGGVIGLLGYELGQCFERLPIARGSAFNVPVMVAALYNWCLAWDHQEEKLWLICWGLSEAGEQDEQRAHERLKQVLHQLENLPHDCSVSEVHSEFTNHVNLDDWTPLQHDHELYSNFSQDAYLDAVERAIEYIRAGDIFQVNLSQQLMYPFLDHPYELYRNAVQHNPAPYAAYFQPSDDWALVSASPEQFLHCDGQEVLTRPIKGTRPKWTATDIDLWQSAELRRCEKDRAENVMIVDLMRNDLSRVAEPGSVNVPVVCQLESFEHVHHLVSEIRANLREDLDVWDLLAAAFPGGSITGAPKIRSMEIIHELEPHARGNYCGSLFFHSLTGAFDSSILIRTMTWKDGWVQCPVGGGIVADSKPINEYEETLHKAVGLLDAVSTAKR